MDEIVGMAMLAAFCWYCYRQGKREGSRKGFHVGRRRRQRNRRR